MLERRTARPSAKREYGVRPAPLSCSSSEEKPVASLTSDVVGVETAIGEEVSESISRCAESAHGC